MAKKSQTRARRNNTQVGPKVVNFYNHGTVNVDARQNNSTSTKYAHANCTVNYTPLPSRPFTINDQIEEGHPILGMVDTESVQPIITKRFTPASKVASAKPTFHKASWGYVAVGISLAAVACGVIAKFINT